MNYKPRTPQGSLNHSQLTRRQDQLDVKQEVAKQHDYSGPSSILGALMWIEFRTRPDLRGAVTRVFRAVK
eukprot:9786834-Prorocentrum_lima.AAC.1